MKTETVEIVWIVNAIQWMWTAFKPVGFCIVAVTLIAMVVCLFLAIREACKNHRWVRNMMIGIVVLMAIVILGRIGYYDEMDATQRHKRAEEVRKIQEAETGHEIENY